MSVNSEDSGQALRVEHFSKVYGGFGKSRRLAADDLTFGVPRGEVFGFLGPNGAGKSTTIKSLLGFLRPTKGRLEILGRPHSDIGVRHRIGYLPEVASYYHYLSPRETLRMFGRLFKMPRADLARRIDEVLDRVGLSDSADDRIGNFSKGMTQRVGIAQALINDPELLILDEPTSGLDPLGRREIRDLIVDLRERGKTVFFSSHELSAVEEVCNTVAILHQGRLVRSGALDDLLPRQAGLEVQVAMCDEARFRAEARWPVEVKSNSGPMTTLSIEGGEMPEVIEALQRSGAEVRAIERRRARLEDVFMQAVNGGESAQ